MILLAGYGRAADPSAASQPETWRSRLYPEDWHPGFKAENGDTLLDFSYAGYHRGERPVPDNPPGAVFDVTAPAYSADPSGQTDSTEAIQRAIDAAGKAGGGIVFLPGGTYRVWRPDDARAALQIRNSRIVLRGEGPEHTRIFNANPVMRQSSVIAVSRVAQGNPWFNPAGETVLLHEDVAAGASTVLLEGGHWEVGDWIILTHDVTEAFVREHRPWLVSHWAGRLPGIAFYRQITRIDAATGRVHLDIPMRYDLKTRDHARAYRVQPHLEEVGIEALSIGMQEHPGMAWGFNAYRTEGTAAYDVHASYIIRFTHVVNGWIRDVHSYKPETNEGPHHIISNGILLNQSRTVTISGCSLQNAQYRGGGGNGYGYVLRSNDCLIQHCAGRELRYVFDFKSMFSNGNVIHRSESHGVSDFHMHMSVANLLDNVHMTAGTFNAGTRGRAGTIPHGLTTYDSVFWNIKGSGRGGKVLRVNDQSDAVLVIGTSGSRYGIQGLQKEYRQRFEGVGKGGTLQPASLFEDQRRRRLE